MIKQEEKQFSRFDNLMNLFLKITVPVILIVLSSIFLYKNHEKQILERQVRMEEVLIKSATMNFSGKDSVEIEEIKKELKK